MRRPPPRSTLFPYTTLFRSFEKAFSAMKRDRAGALIIQPLFANTLGLGPQLAELAAKNSLATISSADVFAEVGGRSEEHTSELQSRGHLVCRLLLEKKKINT